MDTRNVFLYWIGNDYKLIKILRKLIYLHSTNGKGYKVHMINQTNINEYVDTVPSHFNRLLPAHQADYVRIHAVCKYGGIWLDSDTIVLNDLDCLFKILESKDGFFIKENNSILCNGVFGSRAETPLMLKLKSDINTILSKENTHWSDSGAFMLQNNKNAHPELYSNYEIFNGLDTMYPISWSGCLREYIEKPYDNYKTLIRGYQPIIILVNSVYKAIEGKSEEDILNGNLPLNYFIDLSFKNINVTKSL